MAVVYLCDLNLQLSSVLRRRIVVDATSVFSWAWSRYVDSQWQSAINTHRNRIILLVSPLSARTFGTWTLLSAVIRFVGAYHLSSQPVYYITLSSFVLAGFHFVSEWLVYKTAKLGAGLYGPLIVATVTTVWMTLQKDYYVVFWSLEDSDNTIATFWFLFMHEYWTRDHSRSNKNLKKTVVVVIKITIYKIIHYNEKTVIVRVRLYFVASG